MLTSQKDIAGATRDATETSRCNHFSLLYLLFAVRPFGIMLASCWCYSWALSVGWQLLAMAHPTHPTCGRRLCACVA